MSHDDEHRGHACDHHDHVEGFPTPPQDLDIARRALAEGDPKHAAHHLACALAVDPTGEAYLDFASELFAAVPDPVALTTVEGTAYYGQVALRALALRSVGRLPEAVDLLLAVVGTRPDVPFAAWLDTWLPDEASLRMLIARDLAAWMDAASRRIESAPVDPRFRPLGYRAIAALGRRAQTAHPGEPLLAFVVSRALRSAGDLDAAMEVAGAEHERAPSYMSAVFLAGAHRAKGERDRAIELFREALAREPEDIAVRLDIGDLYLDLGRPVDAAAAYDEALAREPEHTWALPSSLYARWLAGGSTELRDRLEALAAAQERGRARDLCDAITPFHGYLPGRPESVLKAVAQALEQNATISSLACSSLEAPSAVHAIRDALRERGQADLDLQAKLPEGRDVREPLRPVSFPLWRYEGLVAEPLLGPPREHVARAVTELAGTRYHAVGWTSAAQRAAPALGSDAIEDLLGAMLHPPPRPAWATSWAWRFRAQVASALLLAFVEEGWGESGRRRALLSLVHGVLDWTTTAGIVAMTQLAHEEPLAREEIVAVLDDLAGIEATPIAFMCVIEPLAHCRLQLPDLTRERVLALRAERARVERSG